MSRWGNRWGKRWGARWGAVAKFFGSLYTLIFKRKDALEAGRKSLPETKLNLVYYLTDILMVVPVLVIMTEAIKEALTAAGLTLFSAEIKTLPVLAVIFLTVFASDFISYWRHRLMHTAALWPVHAAHHSDRQLTWFGLVRFHPINRVVSVGLNILVLSLIGFPPWAIAINAAVRHYYGFFIHADLPLTYGPLRYLLVSPRMHRWHHLKEVEGSGNNFTTIFSIIDVVFGTFYLPKKELGALGVSEADFPTTWRGQFVYPFRVWGKALMVRLTTEAKETPAPDRAASR